MSDIFKKMKEHEYYLHSLVIHSGTANSGHYYVYIKEHAKERWWKYNDAEVKVVNYGEVISQAQSNNMTNACHLVYINKNEYDRVKQ